MSTIDEGEQQCPISPFPETQLAYSNEECSQKSTDININIAADRIRVISLSDGETEDPPSKPKEQQIDTKSLSGLRGIVAVHIMIFHSFLYSE